jgi:Na+/H+-dicarboxylate symporter
VAINRPVEMTLLMLNVGGDAATNVIVCSKEGRLDKEVYNS